MRDIDTLEEVSTTDIADYNSPFEGHHTGTVYGTSADLDQTFDKSGSNVEHTEMDAKFEPFFK